MKKLLSLILLASCFGLVRAGAGECYFVFTNATYPNTCSALFNYVNYTASQGGASANISSYNASPIYQSYGPPGCSGTNGDVVTINYSYVVWNLMGTNVPVGLYQTQVGTASGTLYGTSNTTVVVNMILPGISAPSCFTNLMFNFKNTDIQDHYFWLGENGGPLSDGHCLTFNYVDLSAGQSGSLTWYGPCGDAGAIGVMEGTYYGTGTNITSSSVPDPNTTVQGYSDGGTAPSTNNVPGDAGAFNPPDNVVSTATGTNNPILWSAGTNVDASGGSDANLIAAVKDSGGAIFNAVAQSSGTAHGDAITAHADASAILGAIQAGQTNSLTVNVSNGVAGGSSSSSNVWVQNFPPSPIPTLVGISNLLSLPLGVHDMSMEASLFGMSNVLAQMAGGSNADVATETTQLGMSNLLAGLPSGISNALGNSNGMRVAITNYAQETTLEGISNLLAGAGGTASNPPSFYDFSTNISGATAQVYGTTMGPVLNSLQAIESDFVGPTVPADALPPMVVTFPGISATLDLNPMDYPAFNSLASLSLHFLSWLLVVGYLGKVLADITAFLQWLTDGKTRTIPSLQIDLLGTGGNAAGASLFPIVVSATLVVWATAVGAILAVCFSNAGTDLFATFSAGPLTSAPAGSVMLACQFFPMALFFSLITAYFIFRSTANFAVMLANSITSVLPG